MLYNNIYMRLEFLSVTESSGAAQETVLILSIETTEGDYKDIPYIFTYLHFVRPVFLRKHFLRST